MAAKSRRRFALRVVRSDRSKPGDRTLIACAVGVRRGATSLVLVERRSALAERLATADR
jgi:hypothetical protein